MTEGILVEVPAPPVDAPVAAPLGGGEGSDGRISPLRRLVYSIGLTSVALFTGTLLSTVATVLVARRMGADEWGRSATAASWALLGASLLLFGTPTRLIRDLAASGESALFRHYWRRVCLLALPTAPLVGLVTWAALGPDLAPMGGLLFLLLTLRQAVNVPVQVQRRFGVAAVVTVLERLALLAVVAAVLVLGSVTVTTYVLAQVVATLVAVALLLPGGLRWAGAPDRVSKLRLSHVWSTRSSFGFAAIGVAIAQLDISVVLLWSDQREAGLFALAARLVGPLALVGSAAATVLLPTVAAGGARVALSSGARAKALGVTSVLAVAFVWVGPPVLSALLGPDYRSAESVVRLYLVSTLLVIVNQPTVAWLQARNRDGGLRFLLIGGTAVHLLGTALGAAYDGATGAGWGYLMSNLLLLAVLAVLVWRSREAK